MREAYSLVWSLLVSLFRSRVSLEAEILILRHQLNIQRRHQPKRLTFSAMDRLIFVGLYRLVPKCHEGADDCEAGYRDPLAPRRFQIVLALEIAATLRPTDCAVGNSPADPRDSRLNAVREEILAAMQLETIEEAENVLDALDQGSLEAELIERKARYEDQDNR